MDDMTATNPRQQSGSDKIAMQVWKLRVLYTGASGVVDAQPRCWDGKFRIPIGRRRTSESPRLLGPGLTLDDERVSRAHAEMKCDGKTVLIKDLDSKNGTVVNGRRLRSGETWELMDGDVIRLGDSLLMLRHEQARVADVPIPSIIGCSIAACNLRTHLAYCITSDAPVLILGDTGTGKGIAAETLHRLSDRRGKLVAVNCSAVPSELAESIFFGALMGAYTGASQQPGYFREAHEGTLFLDEVGDLPLSVQPKLLLALESREVTPLGSTQPLPCDVRVVAATHRDPAEDVRSHRFREDLYARLSNDVLRLPPLRQRREDVLLLAQHFGGAAFRPSPQVAEAMVRYDWPRNVREVKSVVGHIQRGAEEEMVLGLLAQLRPAPAGSASSSRTEQQKPRPWKSGDPPPTRRELVELLERYHGSLRRIEIVVGYSRTQFRRWAEKYEINLADYRPPAHSK